MHAMNAVLGRPHFTWPTFLAMTAEFDTIARLPRGTSAALYAATDGQTLFQYAMSRLIPNAILPVSTHRKSAADLETARSRGVAAFAFNAGHAWALKRLDNGTWVKLDSLRGMSPTSIESHFQNGIGLEFVLS